MTGDWNEVSGAAQLSWVPPARGPEPAGYKIYRSDAEGGLSVEVGEVGAVTQWDDTTVAEGNEYWYEMASIAEIYESARSSPRRRIYAGYEPGEWVTTQVDSELGATSQESFRSSIAINQVSDQLHISYYSNETDQLFHAQQGTGAKANEWDDPVVVRAGVLAWYGVVNLVDAAGNAHIIYGDSLDAALHHCYYDGADWQHETIEDIDEVTWELDAVIDELGRIHVSYYDAYSEKHCLKYALHDGISWSTEVVDDTKYVGRSSSIDVDSNNLPHISYWDQNGDNLMYAYYDGSDWQISVADASTDDVGTNTSIVLDENDEVHISYLDWTNYNLKYATFNGTWGYQTVDSDGDVGMYTSIALDASGEPCISYRDTTNSNIKFVSFNGADWNPAEFVDPAYNANGIFSSMVFDSSNQPHLSSFIQSTAGDMNHSTRSAGT